eukprot:TRINITY_DN443_c0_g1_i1.p1 TRINITY_DN443_c0_g1~~TRINITY_DN443_c0_g1_i1.p1  ORF type:complete len:534 (+),score=89.97 TRINITY_DN443_c0_g1_i1:100-1701(+)
MGNASARSSSLGSNSSSEHGSNQGRPSYSRSNSHANDSKVGTEMDIRSDYQIEHVLGSGSFGEVRQVTLIKDPKIVRAVKIIELDDGEETNKRAAFYSEVAVLDELKHPNIVQCWESYEDRHFLYLIMDLCRGGEIFGMIVALRSFTESDASMVSSQALEALDYIHSKGIMHRDIKAENFLFMEKSPQAVVKLIDFGMSTHFDHEEVFSETCGSPHYLAPELIGQKYGHMVDMWAFGVLLYLMLYGRYPYDGRDCREIMLKILDGKVRYKRKGEVSQLTNLAVHLLQGCLDVKPKRRFSAKEALSHPWIVKAGKPDDSSSSSSNLIENVQAAQEAVQSSRSKVPAEVKQRRENTLRRLEEEFMMGTHNGRRLNDPKEEEFMSKPEAVRRRSRIWTAPSKQVQYLREKVAGKVGAAVGRTKVKEDIRHGMPKEEAAKQEADGEATSPIERPRQQPKRLKKMAMSVPGSVDVAQRIGKDELAWLRKKWEDGRRTDSDEKLTTTDLFGLLPSGRRSMPHAHLEEDAEQDSDDGFLE